MARTLRISAAAARRLQAGDAAPAPHRSRRAAQAGDDSEAAVLARLLDAPAPIAVAVAALPPTVNHMYQGAGGGRKALTAEALRFRAAVARAVPAGAAVPAGRLMLTLRLTFPDRRRCDIDNRVKAALDALALALEFDDARVDRLVVERAEIARNRPACAMLLEAL